MQPLLDTKVFLRTKLGPGFTQPARAVLYEDHIEIMDKTGALVLNATFRELQNAGKRGKMIHFVVQGRFFLILFSSPLTVFLSFMGPLGTLIGAFADEQTKNLRTWTQALEQHGVTLNAKS